MTRTILPDTNIMSAILRGEASASMHIAAELAANTHVIIGAIVYYELRRGMMKRGWSSNVSYLDGMIARLDWADVTRNDAAEAARLWADTQRAGKTIDDTDILIAAQANTRRAVVVTRNVDHFKNTAKQLETW